MKDQNDERKRRDRIQNGTNRVTVRSKHSTFWENERALYILLTDHPFFVASVASERKKLGIPRDGFLDGQRAFEWEHADRASRRNLTEAIEKILQNFTVKSAFLTEVKLFAYNYTLSPKIVEHQLAPFSESEDVIRFVGEQKIGGRHKIGAQIIRTGDDIELNKYQFRTRAVYLELTEHTGRRDVTLALKEATKRKKERLPFSVPKPQAIARRVWHLTQEKLPDRKIAELIRRQFGKKDFGYNDVPVYRRRYKNALATLKQISE